VLNGVAPVANFRVENHLSSEGGEFAVSLQFREMADFRPESVVQQVAPLKGLLDARSKLADLRNKLAGNDKLEDILNDVLTNTEKLDSLRKTEGGQGNGGDPRSGRRPGCPRSNWTPACSTRSSSRAGWRSPAASTNARATSSRSW
jgi:hypothetical protein